MLKEVSIDVVTGEETRIEFTPEELATIEKRRELEEFKEEEY